jgi:hypothetical protein
MRSTSFATRQIGYTARMLVILLIVLLVVLLLGGGLGYRRWR